MSLPALRSLSITDFRSISGTVVLPLDAQVVLVHGPNGTGKTSVVSALELALTGAISELPWPETRHLVHHGTSQATIELTTSSRQNPRFEINSSTATGTALLGSEDARFLSERCYLAQTTLGGLLDTYQTVEKRGESPLTRFVNELLRLDELDALIDGLAVVKDIRNIRHLVPQLGDAEKQMQTSSKRMATGAAEEKQLSGELDQSKQEIRRLVEALGSPEGLDSDDEPALRRWLGSQDEERRLVQRIAVRQELSALQKRWAELNKAQTGNTEAAETAAKKARAEADAWLNSSGAKIEAILDSLRGELPALPAGLGASDPIEVHQTALGEVTRELESTESSVRSDQERHAEIESLNKTAALAHARLKTVDEQLTSVGTRTGTEELGRALAVLVPHVHGDDCPVCGRDYREISDEPLSAHVAKRISELAEKAEQLQALANARVEAAGELARCEETLRELAPRQLSESARETLATKVATLRDGERALSELSSVVRDGANAIRQALLAERAATIARDRDRTTGELRASISTLSATIGLTLLDGNDGIQLALEQLEETVNAEITAIEHRQTSRSAIGERLTNLQRVRASYEETQASIQTIKSEHTRMKSAVKEFERRRARARSLLDDAEAGRTRIVRRVFNESLNTTWRELFVRLAPEEQFVPAFEVPGTSKRVSANLLTTHRDGTPAGAPAAMLSAGNLNTAALTLFLALHLSAAPRLPWLLLDDPVQSMDEVHVSQFAALLRTLTKQYRRQLVIAVHERPLFEYLTLELSPSQAGDRLAAIDLSSSPDGSTAVHPTVLTYESDAVQTAA
jgi:DNA repair protein SbcC/Rad50